MYSCIIGRSSFEGSVIKKLERVKKEIEQEKPEKDFGLFRLKEQQNVYYGKNLRNLVGSVWSVVRPACMT